MQVTQLFQILTASVIFVIASIIAIGWLTDNPNWIRFGATEAVMRFNTTLVLLVVAIGFFSLALRQTALVTICGLFVIVLPGTTALQHIFQIDLGIDSFLVQDRFNFSPYVGNRMALNSAFCFVMLGTVFVELGLKRRLHFVATMCSSSILAIAGLALVGRFLGLDASPSLTSYYGMAVPTACCLLLSGSCLFYLVIKDQQQFNSRAFIVPIAIGNGALICTLILWHGLTAMDYRQTQQIVRADFVNLKTEMQSEIRHHRLALDRMGRRWMDNNYTNQEVWQRDANTYMRDLEGFRSIAIYDSRSANWWIEPRSVSPDDINPIVETLSFENTPTELATDARLPTQMIPGKKTSPGDNCETWICMPLILNKQIVASLVANFDIKHFFNSRQKSLSILDKIIVIRSGDEIVYSNTLNRDLQQSPMLQQSDLKIGDTTLSLFVAPTQNWILEQQSNVSIVALITGSIITVLAAATSRLAIINLHTKSEEVEVAKSTLVVESQERWLAEQKRKTSERQFSEVFERAPIGKFLVQLDGKFIRVNPQFCKMLGYTEEELMSMSVNDIVIQDERYRNNEEHDDILTKRSDIYQIEKKFISKTGEIVPVLYCSICLDDKGDQTLFLGDAVDLTLLKQAEERIKRVIEAAPCGMLMIDHDGKIVMVNSLIEDMFGYTRNELIGQMVEMLLPEKFRPDHPQHRDQFFAQPQTRSMGAGRELFGQRKDGSQFPVELGLNPILNREGLFVLSSIVDITERKKAERAQMESYEELQHITERLHDSTERFELAVRGNADGIWDWNVVTNSVFYAPRYKELLGYADDEFDGTLDAWRSLVHPDDVERVLGELNNHIYKRTPYNVEHRILHRNGEYRWHWARGQAIWDESGKAIRMVGSSSDITNRKHAEQTAQQFSDELKRSNQDLEQFAYVASHDLQEPLRKVASCCQVLAEDYADILDEKGHEWIKYAVDGAKRMGVLISDLLAFSRIGTQGSTSTPVNAQSIYDEAIESLTLPIKEANAQVICRPLPTVLGNETQLLHLFQNLIGNAIKYRSDTPLVVEIGAEPIRNEFLDRNPQEMWQFYIRDNGIGIDPEYYEKIFVIFQRLHNREKYEGTGIGLALCKKIVERLKGRIWVESKPGHGSTFFFTIPAVEKHTTLSKAVRDKAQAV